MALKNDDNSQWGVIRSDGQQPGLTVAHGGYPTLDGQGRIVVVTPMNGFMISNQESLFKRTGNFYGVMAAGPLYLMQAWGSMEPGAAGNNWVHFFNSIADPPAGGPYIPALPVEPGGGMWSISFPEGLRFSTGLTIGYSQTYGNWLQAANGGQFACLCRFP